VLAGVCPPYIGRLRAGVFCAGPCLFIPAIRNLQSATPLALDDDLAVVRAQFDLSNVTARAVNLLGDQSRALQAAGLLALRDVAASMDAEGLRLGIEIGLEHKREVKDCPDCTLVMSPRNVHGPLGTV
jgi:hypothetical protein